MAREPRLDPVGIALAQLVAPGSVSRLELAGGVALDAPRQLLELDPQEPLARRGAALVHRQGLAADDRRLGRQQPPLRLVHRARDAVEPRRDVNDRRPAEALVAVPPRGLGEREVDLHLRSPVPEPPCGLGHGRRHLGLVEQALVELRRRHVGDHGPLCRHDLAAGEPDAGRPAGPDEHALGVLARFADAAAVADQAHERVGEHGAAAARHRHPALLDRDRDHLRHEARGRGVRTEPRVQDPGRQQAVSTLRRERLLQPVAARLEQLAGEGGGARAAEPAHRLRAERQPGRRPELRAQHAEREVCIGQEALEDAGPLRADLGGVPSRVAEQEGGAAVGKRGRRRQVGIQVLEAALGELWPELRVRRPGDPERMPGAEDVVAIAGHRELGRVDRAAEPVVSLEHADAPARARQQRRARERVDAAPDDDRVVVSHRGACGTRRRSRAPACARRAPSPARARRPAAPPPARGRAPRP